MYGPVERVVPGIPRVPVSLSLGVRVAQVCTQRLPLPVCTLCSLSPGVCVAQVCTQRLPLPEGVEVTCATPAAGHLSSSSIYPACFATYHVVTACSDNSVRWVTRRGITLMKLRIAPCSHSERVGS